MTQVCAETETWKLDGGAQQQEGQRCPRESRRGYVFVQLGVLQCFLLQLAMLAMLLAMLLAVGRPLLLLLLLLLCRDKLAHKGH